MKKKVALIGNGWNGENLDNFIKGFRDEFRKDELDLFVFTSFATFSTDGQFDRESEDTIYDLPDVAFFDAVIIFATGIKSDDIVYDLIDKCKKAGVPVLLQGFEIDGIPSVTIDNYVGMKQLCEHLIEKHQVKDVVYIAGNRDNEDSNLRLQVLKDSLHAHGYEFGEENVYYADWEPRMVHSFIVDTYGKNKKPLPDAFVCANDQMAIFVLVFLEELGFKLPDDAIVTGFDNLHAGRLYYPSLATVDQRFTEQGRECAKLTIEKLGNPQMFKKSVISTAADFGESCGCIDCKGETELRKQVGRNFWSNQYTADNMRGREAHLDMCVMSVAQFEDVHDALKKDFFATSGVETDDFHVYVNTDYKDLAYMNGGTNREVNLVFTPFMDVIAAKTDGIVSDQKVMRTSELLLDYNGEGAGKTYVFKTLKVDIITAGYMVIRYIEGDFENRKYTDLSGSINKILKKYQKNIDDFNRAIRIQEQADIFLRQTVEALASAVDAKDSYTHGHSARVAKYARKIAEISGIEEKDCDDIYLAGLLHDIGKIGIDDGIINKKGKLTTDEFGIIKQHPVLGEEILAKIQMSPNLSVGARHHHERYDGRGYPDGLKGEDIPQIARIIAVADAYDAMTSKRSYRDTIPQMYVREELVKGTGTQFDPVYAKIMINLLDDDEEYKMKEIRSEEVFEAHKSYSFTGYKTMVTPGLRITDCPVTVHIQYEALKEGGNPTLLFYDSADEKYYVEESNFSEDMDFIEFANVGMNGDIVTEYVRDMKHTSEPNLVQTDSGNLRNVTLNMVKKEDHLRVRVKTDESMDEFIFALCDATRYMYMAMTGAHCQVDILDVDVDAQPVGQDEIPRIADRISFIDKPAGDIPNVQIDGWRSDRSEVIAIKDEQNIRFHSMSLPSSRRIWHCPIICLYTSDDGTVGGPNYREFTLVRLEGEVWSECEGFINISSTSKGESFENWNTWKQRNKAGVDCRLNISHKGDSVYLEVENTGLTITNQTKLTDDVEYVYCFLTGDQCAITDIHII